MPFPLSRSIASLLPANTMADVQTNLLSYIITKLHSDVARIESLIHQVHTGKPLPTRPPCSLPPAAAYLSVSLSVFPRRRLFAPSTPNIQRRCPTHPLKGAPANPRRPRACAPDRSRPAWLVSPANNPPDAHPQLQCPTRRVSSCAATPIIPGSQRRSPSEARGAPASEESTGPGVVGLQHRR